MKLDRRILSPLFIDVDIDLRYFITVLLSVHVRIYHCYLLFMKHNLYMWDANKMLFFFQVLCSFKFREKILTPALFVNDFCSPKVTTPLKLRPPKAANSESNEGRYYRNSTVVDERHKTFIHMHVIKKGQETDKPH